MEHTTNNIIELLKAMTKCNKENIVKYDYSDNSVPEHLLEECLAFEKVINILKDKTYFDSYAFTYRNYIDEKKID